MPAQETSGLKQKAVLWAASGFDNDGEPKVASPVEISVRWEAARSERSAPDGAPIGDTIDVMVDREIAIGSIMWLGELANVPSPPTNLKKVDATDYVPDVKARNFQRSVTLTRYSNELPTLA